MPATFGHRVSQETKEKIRQAMIGRKFSPETLQKMREVKKGYVPITFSKLHTPEVHEKIRQTLTGRKLTIEHRKAIGIASKRTAKRGRENPNWSGGKYSKDRYAREILEYKLWRESVFERDNYTCVLCHTRGGMLNADHIKSFSLYKELRYEITNGRTLCITCHRQTPTYGYNARYQRN